MNVKKWLIAVLFIGVATLFIINFTKINTSSENDERTQQSDAVIVVPNQGET